MRELSTGPGEGHGPQRRLLKVVTWTLEPTGPAPVRHTETESEAETENGPTREETRNSMNRPRNDTRSSYSSP